MSTYCAPCLADLALVREAVTTVSGTAACVAHAVLLTHPTDNPQRRLTRLSDLRAMAEEKLPTASDEDRPKIELLVQEYALAGAMDMTVPLKELAGDRSPRPPKNRRDRDRNRGDRGPRGEGGGGPRGEGGGPRGDRQGGDRGPRPEAPAASDLSGSESAPTSPAPDNSAPESSAPAETPAPGSTWDVSDAGSAPTPPAADNSAEPAPAPASTPEVSDGGGAPTPAASDNSPADTSAASAPEQAGGE